MRRIFTQIRGEQYEQQSLPALAVTQPEVKKLEDPDRKQACKRRGRYDNTNITNMAVEMYQNLFRPQIESAVARPLETTTTASSQRH